jgi:putative PIN family toxin of toxin-antitoxin system
LRHFVLDTNVVVFGVLWGGTPRLLFDAIDEGNLRISTSIAMLSEMAEILERPKFAARIAASGQAVNEIIQGYASWCSIVAPTAIAGVTPDPDDNIVIDTALAAGAEAIVTGDAAFRGIGHWRDIAILDVRMALDQLVSRPKAICLLYVPSYPVNRIAAL